MAKRANRTGRTAVLKELKEFARNGIWSDDDFGQVLADETDRGCVIILVTILDDVLGAELQKHMRPLSNDDADRLFEFGAPIGTFSARIKLAYAMEIIDKSTRNSLEVLRHMRNACAHSRSGICFKDVELRNALGLLFDDSEERAWVVEDRNPLLARIHFMAAIRFVMAKIAGATDEDATKAASWIYEILKREIDADIQASR